VNHNDRAGRIETEERAPLPDARTIPASRRKHFPFIFNASLKVDF